MPRKRYSADIKAKAVLEVLKERKPATEIASHFSVPPTLLSSWKKMVIDGLPAFFAEPTKRSQASKDQAQLDRLYQQIGQLQVELDWLKKKSGG